MPTESPIKGGGGFWVRYGMWVGQEEEGEGNLICFRPQKVALDRGREEREGRKGKTKRNWSSFSPSFSYSAVLLGKRRVGKLGGLDQLFLPLWSTFLFSGGVPKSPQ